jgi:hypothetical protein
MLLVIASFAIGFCQPAISLRITSTITTYHDMAVGVHTGGPKAAAYIDSLKKTVLQHIPKSLIMGDVADPARGIEEAPGRSSCTRTSSSEQHLTDSDFESRGRCTQFRFAYLFMSLQEKFPDEKWYIISDSDAWFDVDGLHNLLQTYDNIRPRMMGVPDPSPDRPELVWGPVLIFNGALSKKLHPSALMGCISYWYFATDVFQWRPGEEENRQLCFDGKPGCWNLESKTVFDECQHILATTCGHLNATQASHDCLAKLQQDSAFTSCNFQYVQPEYPVPMYVKPNTWDINHGDDHFFSFCAITVGGGELVAPHRFSFAPPNSLEEVCREKKRQLSYHQLEPNMIELIDDTRKNCG